MGLFSSYFKRKINLWFSSEFWTYQKVLFFYLLKKKGQSFTIRLHGFKIKANDARALVGMYREIFLQKQYDFKADSKSPLIIDCGANIGIATLFYKKNIPQAQIICIEADPAVADVLMENVKENNLQEITVIDKAAWINENEKLLFSNQGSDSGSVFGTGSKIEVTTMRLKDLISSHKEIDMLKMDIEGAEIDVLEDCAEGLNHVKKAFVEFHSFPAKPQELEKVLSILAYAGFRYFVLPVRRIDSPFRFNFNNEEMDLQLNIFAYRP